MTTKILIATAASLALMAGNPAIAAEDARFVKQVGNWRIVLSESLNNTCNMLAVYPDNRSLWLGFVRLKDLYGFGLQITNKGWDSLLPKEQYVLKVQLDNAEPWNLTMTAHPKPDGFKSLLSVNLKIEFIEEFKKASTITFFYHGNLVFKGLLTDGGAAVSAMVDCQRTVDNWGQRNDPFAGTTSDLVLKARDPFAIKP
jgi:hypothetical protein